MSPSLDKTPLTAVTLKPIYSPPRDIAPRTKHKHDRRREEVTLLIYGIDPSQRISHAVKPEPLAKLDLLEHVLTKRPHWSKMTLHSKEHRAQTVVPLDANLEIHPHPQTEAEADSKSHSRPRGTLVPKPGSPHQPPASPQPLQL